MAVRHDGTVFAQLGGMSDVPSSNGGVDETTRVARLRASGLSDADHAWVDVLHRRVVQPHVHELATLLRRNLGAVRAQVVRAHANAGDVRDR